MSAEAKIILDLSDIEKGFKAYQSSLKETERKLEEFDNAAERVFQTEKTAKVNAMLKKQYGIIEKLEDRQKRLNMQLRKAKSENTIAVVNSKLDETNKELTRLRTKSVEAFAAMKKGSDAANVATNKLLGTLESAVAIATVTALGAQLKNVADQTNEAATAATMLAQKGDNIDDLTQKIRFISIAYQENAENIKLAANALTNEYGVSGAKALDIIDKSLERAGGNFGEVLDNLREYPANLREASVSLEQFAAITVMAQRQGVFSDYGLATIEEGLLRLRELPKATQDALTKIGISSTGIKDLIEKKGVFAAIQLISEKLSTLKKDSPEVGEAIANIFGAAGEKAGYKYITSLKDVSTNLDDIEVKTTAITQSNRELAKEIAELSKDISKEGSAINTVYTGTLDLLTSFFGFIRKNANTILQLSKGVIALGVAYVGFKISAMLANDAQTQGISLSLKDITVKRLQATATNAVTTATKAFTTALKTNPIGVVLTIITTALTAYSLFSSNVKEASVNVGELNTNLTVEQDKLSNVFTRLKNAGIGTTERNTAITQINIAYGEYLPNLLTEKSTLQEIESAQNLANAALVNSIALKAKDADITNAVNASLEKQKTAIQNIKERLTDRTNSEIAGAVTADIQQFSKEAENQFDVIKKLAAKYSKIYDKTTVTNILLSVEGSTRFHSNVNDIITARKEEAAAMEEITKFYNAYIETLGGVTKATNTNNNATTEADLLIKKLTAEIERLKKLQGGETETKGTSGEDLERLRIDAMAEGLAKRIALSEYEYNKRIEKTKAFGIEIAALEADRDAKTLELINDAQADELAAMEEKERKLREQLNAEFEMQQAYEESVFDLVERSESERTVFEIEQRIKRLEFIKENGKDLTEIELATYDNLISALRAKLATAEQPEISKAFDVSEILPTLKDAAAEIISVYQQIADARVSAAETSIAATQQELSVLQDSLQTEMQLNEAGFASNVALKQQEIADAQTNYQIALKQQQEAQRAKAKIESAQQASAIITAIADLIAQWSTLGPLGYVAGLTQVGILLAGYAGAKQKARQLRDGATGLLPEGLISGPTHENGGVPFTPYEVEGGEYHSITPRREAKKYLPILDAIRMDDIDAMKTHVDRIANNYQDLNYNKFVTQTTTNNFDTAKLEVEFRNLRVDFAKLSKLITANKIYTDNKIIISKGNTTKTINK